VLAGWNNFRSMVSGYEIQPAPPTPSSTGPILFEPLAVEESLANEPMAEEIAEGEHE